MYRKIVVVDILRLTKSRMNRDRYHLLPQLLPKI